MSKSPVYYDWRKTLSYNADVTMVVGARGIGKTFGLRLQCIRDWQKDASRFVEICRYKTEIPDVARGYFDRLEQLDEFRGWMFKTDGKSAYISVRSDEPEWFQIGYFVALTEMQKSKKRTFEKVKRLIMDEATIERKDRYHGYLRNEFALLANVVDSCTRERPEDDDYKPHVYLLSNACDLMNPYFERYGIDNQPAYGYSWYDHKTFLLHYLEAGEYAAEKRDNTVAGRMLRGTEYEQVSAFNEFTEHTDGVGPKPSNAEYYWGFVWMGERFGIWWDHTCGLFYITSKTPKANHIPLVALSRDDNRIDRIMVESSNIQLKMLAKIARLNQLRFETIGKRERFSDAMRMFGIK